MKAYITANSGAKTSTMPYYKAVKYARLLEELGNYNVQVVRV